MELEMMLIFGAFSAVGVMMKKLLENRYLQLFFISCSVGIIFLFVTLSFVLHEQII